MSGISSNEIEKGNDSNISKNLPPIKLIQQKTNLTMGLSPKTLKRRCVSAPYIMEDFVPKLKPIKEKLCPSPIILSEKSPPKIDQDIQITTDFKPSFDSNKEFKKIKIELRGSLKDIDEKIYSISDCEEKDKKGINDNFELESSKIGEENDKNKIKLIKLKNENKNKISTINKMRIKMASIKNASLKLKNVFDDSNIKRKLKEKTFQIFNNIQSNFVRREFRNNKHKNLYPLNSFKYRNKSHQTRKNFIPTILGFLENNKSGFSLYSTEKK